MAFHADRSNFVRNGLGSLSDGCHGADSELEPAQQGPIVESEGSDNHASRRDLIAIDIGNEG